MKKNTPMVMGLILIVGIAALGYFADLDKQHQDSTNYSFFKYHNLTNETASDDTNQTSKSSDNSSQNKTKENDTNITSPNIMTVT
ncbi:MAG: hypothetical protein PHQ17_04500 [Methanobacterium sp.]|jgi:hypothetical protein|nr:hypothetical protein [Methanobacterium sp.]